MRPITRRQFIGGAAAAAAATVLRPGAAPAREEAPAAAARAMAMDLNCGAIGVRAGLAEAFDLAHRHGFEAFDPSAEELARLDAAGLERLLATMREKRVSFGAAGLPVDFRGSDESFDAGMEALPGIAAGLRRAGVTRMGTWINPAHDRLTYRQNFDQHLRRLRRTAAVLEDHGVRLGLEYVGPKTSWSRRLHPFVHTMKEARELIAEIGRKNVGLVLDSWHWYTAHEVEGDILALSGGDVVAVDLNDAPAGKAVDEQVDSQRELPCATGVIDAGAFLRALARIGYDGPVRAEPFNAALRALPPEEAVAATVRAMKAAFAKLG
jgi:sugar phosphate isomerase/epimerase